MLTRMKFQLHKGLQGNKEVYVLSGNGDEAFFYSLEEVQSFLNGFDSGGMVAFETMYVALGKYGLAPPQKKASLMVKIVSDLAEYYQTTTNNTELLKN